MIQNLALEFVRVTEAAAIASAKFIGKGDSIAADQAAVDAMRKAFNSVDIDGEVVIGEGERDEAPMLFIGEKVGKATGGEATSSRATNHCPHVDIALDPLEGTSICAKAGYGALSVLAVAPQKSLLHAPDTYMDKIAVGPEGCHAVCIEESPTKNIQSLSKALKKDVSDITVTILNRPRHKELLAEVRKTKARVQLIDDGDVSAAIMAAQKNSGVDLLLGIGGAPEGVLAAVALKCLGGKFEGQLKFRNAQEKERSITMGLKNPDQVLKSEKLVSSDDILFIATGVTNGPLLKGVQFSSEFGIKTFSMVIHPETVRYIENIYHLNKIVM